MDGGTFFKVGGHKRTSKKLYKILAVWISNCDVTSIDVWRHYIYTPFEGLNYTTLDKITQIWKSMVEPREI